MIHRGLLQVRKLAHQMVRKLINSLPQSKKFAVYRSFVDCDPAPTERLVLKIAETQEELEACFALLHDAYVGVGFMKPHPSGMRVTIYHALPTTTTLCAKWDGEVIGTLSLIRESALGFPLQRIFDLTEVRAQEGNIAEVSALAVHRKFRKTGGSILFPLMKFMYEYCTTFFDTRHLVIAVNPSHIEMYESLLFFRRLNANMVENYDFVNGAPAVGATLDLYSAEQVFKRYYASKPAKRNLHAYFTEVKLPNIQLPQRRYYTTNDPVMTPELLNHFFNVRTQVFENLDERQKALLHDIYDLPEYRRYLPEIHREEVSEPVRRHERFSVKCPGELSYVTAEGERASVQIDVIQVSYEGFQARAFIPVPLETWAETTVQLGEADISHLTAQAVREVGQGFYGFHLSRTDSIWSMFVSALYKGSTHGDLHSQQKHHH